MSVTTHTGATPASRLEIELREQGAVLAARSGAKAAAAAAAITDTVDVSYLLIAARGSSDNVARFAQYALGMETHLSVGLAAPSLFRAGCIAPDLRGAAVLGISQSGQSPDIVGVLEAARSQGRPAIAITNDTASPLAQTADVVVALDAGPEQSVAATKTYLASLHAVMQVVEAINPQAERRSWLERLPELVEQTVAEHLDQRRRFDALDEFESLTVVGRGLQLSTAFETALKIRELAGMMTEAFSPADLMHGPVAALNRNGAIWLIDPDEQADQATQALVELAAQRGITMVRVSARPVKGAREIHVSLSPDLPRWVNSTLAVIPGQVAGFALAERRGVDLDHPHGLRKVTLTS